MRCGENPSLFVGLDLTQRLRATAQQATQDYALEASLLRIITTPAIPRLSNNKEDDSGTGWKVTLSMKAMIEGSSSPTVLCI